MTKQQFKQAYGEDRKRKHEHGIFKGMHFAATSGRGHWHHEEPWRAAHAALHDREQVDPLFNLGLTPWDRLRAHREYAQRQEINDLD